eukprot:TRINITY_DN4523_c0_g6_i1.p1 TRINITY_DN4523_c0_g6~~TRINITY_DN4523_c0_g6_i1.p1  ORF type:complete len:1751 (+),score=643.27 TRINITY_DN4523_c0_g6_i1:662-5254(+)
MEGGGETETTEDDTEDESDISEDEPVPQPPASAAAPAPAPAPAESTEEESEEEPAAVADFPTKVKAYFTLYDREKLSAYDEVMRRYAGKEQMLLTALETKHGPLTAADLAEAAARDAQAQQADKEEEEEEGEEDEQAPPEPPPTDTTPAPPPPPDSASPAEAVEASPPLPVTPPQDPIATTGAQALQAQDEGGSPPSPVASDPGVPPELALEHMSAGELRGVVLQQQEQLQVLASTLEGYQHENNRLLAVVGAAAPPPERGPSAAEQQRAAELDRREAEAVEQEGRLAAQQTQLDEDRAAAARSEEDLAQRETELRAVHADIADRLAGRDVATLAELDGLLEEAKAKIAELEAAAAAGATEDDLRAAEAARNAAQHEQQAFQARVEELTEALDVQEATISDLRAQLDAGAQDDVLRGDEHREQIAALEQELEAAREQLMVATQNTTGAADVEAEALKARIEELQETNTRLQGEVDLAARLQEEEVLSNQDKEEGSLQMLTALRMILKEMYGGVLSCGFDGGHATEPELQPLLTHLSADEREVVEVLHVRLRELIAKEREGRQRCRELEEQVTVLEAGTADAARCRELEEHVKTLEAAAASGDATSAARIAALEKSLADAEEAASRAAETHAAALQSVREGAGDVAAAAREPSAQSAELRAGAAEARATAAEAELEDAKKEHMLAIEHLELQVDEQKEELAAVRAEAEAARATQAAEEGASEADASRVAQLEVQLHDAQNAAVRAGLELEAAKDEVARLTTVANDASSNLAAWETRLEQKEAEFAAQREAIDEIEAGLEAREAHLREDTGRGQDELAALEQVLEERAAKVAADEKYVERMAQEMKDRVAQAEEEAAQLQRDYEAKCEELARQEETLADREVALACREEELHIEALEAEKQKILLSTAEGHPPPQRTPPTPPPVPTVDVSTQTSPVPTPAVHESTMQTSFASSPPHAPAMLDDVVQTSFAESPPRVRMVSEMVGGDTPMSETSPSAKQLFGRSGTPVRDEGDIEALKEYAIQAAELKAHRDREVQKALRLEDELEAEVAQREAAVAKLAEAAQHEADALQRLAVMEAHMEEVECREAEWLEQMKRDMAELERLRKYEAEFDKVDKMRQELRAAMEMTRKKDVEMGKLQDRLKQREAGFSASPPGTPQRVAEEALRLAGLERRLLKREEDMRVLDTAAARLDLREQDVSRRETLIASSPRRLGTPSPRGGGSEEALILQKLRQDAADKDAQLRELAADLAARETDLGQREDEIAEAIESLEREKDRLVQDTAERAGELDFAEGRLQQREAQVIDREVLAEQCVREALKRSEELSEWEGQLREREDAHADAVKVLQCTQETQKEVVRREEELRAQSDELKTLLFEVRARAAHLESKEQRLAEKERSAAAEPRLSQRSAHSATRTPSPYRDRSERAFRQSHAAAAEVRDELRRKDMERHVGRLAHGKLASTAGVSTARPRSRTPLGHTSGSHTTPRLGRFAKPTAAAAAPRPATGSAYLGKGVVAGYARSASNSARSASTQRGRR